jgi:asparagine synthase (glutamine-hydrolysing)
MCGLAAIYSTKPANPINLRRQIQIMTDELAHRGPDGEGHFIEPHIALGHRRLSILELSPLGAQPMTSRTDASHERYVIVFNGEIYNYLELNQRLEAQHRIKPKSNSDTETILNLYEIYGEACVEHLRGMFAFVIWDKVENTLFGARDRFGQKPLLYAKTNDGFVFASEIKAILKSGLVERKLNLRAVDSLLETGSVRQPDTMIQNVFHLPPATALKIKNGEWTSWSYWDATFPSAQRPHLDYSEAKSELRRLFFETLEQHLISDVPLGVFLSGGIDSSLIVAAMRSIGQETKTFSIGFDVGGASYNETHHAKQVATRYQTHHTELVLSENDVLSDIEKIVFGIDQPSCDGLNTFVISKVTRRHVTVALSGLGSDEIFGGYTGFKFAQRLASFQPITRLAAPIFKSAAEALNQIAPPSLQESWHWRAAMGVFGAYQDTANLYRDIRAITPPAIRKDWLLNSRITDLDSPYRKALQASAIRGANNPIQELSYLELKFYMMNTLLRDTDAMSMANSLEVRAPFLDHRLAEFVAALPAHYKIDEATKNIGKKILVDAFSDLLPNEIIYRKKMGFVFPLGIWMRSGKFRTLLMDTLSTKSLAERGLFNAKRLEIETTNFLNQTESSTRDYRTYLRLWMILLLELWLRRFAVSL